VSLDVAMGIITLHFMPLLSPSMAKVLLKPTNPNLAELKCLKETLLRKQVKRSSSLRAGKAQSKLSLWLIGKTLSSLQASEK